MANVWQKAFNRIFWRNKDKGAPFTPLGESNLLPMDASVDEMDDRILILNTSKADQSDLLQTIKTLTYNTSTGVFVFTFWNGTTYTVDLNIEKIPVSFSLSPEGVLTMVTEDGTTYTCDIASLIKLYTFSDSTDIDFTTTTDASGNKTITAHIVDGSVTEEKLEPNFLANCRLEVTKATQQATNSENSAKDSEAYAIGKRGGTDVPSTDPAYHNNSKYYAEQAEASLSNTVRSFNSRTGAVVPVKGDYDISKITPTSGAVEGQIPVVVNNGTAQEPDYGFALGYASSSGIGSASLTLLNQRFSVTMNQKFSLVEGAYLAISFPNNDYPGHNKANLTIGNFGNIAVKVDGTVIPDSEEIGREEKILKAGETGLFVYDGTYLNLVDKNGSSGHSILDQDGTSMSQEDALQFADSFVSDDDVNGKTVVENIKEVDPADYDSTTDEGIIVCDDGNDALIGSVSDDYVEVTADGNTTYAQLLKDLNVDVTKLTDMSVILVGGQIFNFAYDGSEYWFTRTYIDGTTSKMSFDRLRRMSNGNWSCIKIDTSNTLTDQSSFLIPQGTVITLYYGNKKAVVDLQTTANRCLMQSGANVQETLRNMRYYDVSIGNGSSITLNIDQTDRFTIYLNHSSNTNRTYIGFGCGGSNAHIEDIIANASITKTAGSKTITLTNNTGGSISGWIEISQTGAFSIT